MGLKPRVLIADDDRKILTWVSDLLRSRFEVVAEVTDGRAALEAAAKFDPDLVVLDIAMPELNGIQAARELQRLGLRAKIVFLTLYRDDDYVSAAFETGALGFVHKSRLHTNLIPALDHALEGYRFVSPHGFRGQETHVTTWFPRDRGFHSMQFYHDDRDRLAGGVDFVVAALKEGGMVIYVDSKPHLAALARKLEVFGLRAAVERGHFIALDVHRDVLPDIMVGGMPDAARMIGLFDDAVRQTSSSGQDGRRLALAGEIAPVLWAEGLPEAALEVERVADEFAHARSASVFCTYPVESLYETRHHQTMARLCALHTNVVPEMN